MSKDRPMSIARVSTLEGYFRKTESAKNKGSLRNLNPRSQDCCPLYAVRMSEGLKFSKTLVADPLFSFLLLFWQILAQK